MIHKINLFYTSNRAIKHTYNCKFQKQEMEENQNNDREKDISGTSIKFRGFHFLRG